MLDCLRPKVVICFMCPSQVFDDEVIASGECFHFLNMRQYNLDHLFVNKTLNSRLFKTTYIELVVYINILLQLF